MIGYRVESSCARTGEYQHTAVLDTFEQVAAHCTEPWRGGSVHVVYVLHPGLPPRMSHVFAGGVCVSPRFGYVPR